MSPNDPLAAERLGLGRDTFASQTAVVTGGGRGIGREIVRTLAWLGARVVIAEVADSAMRALAMVVTAATLLAAACGDRQGPTEASIAGTYELQTVDGKPLPVVDTQQQSALMSGALMLGGAGAFTVTNNYRMGPGGSAGDLTLSVSGTFRVSGQTITFSALDQGAGSVTFSGTVSGNTLTVTLNGSVMVYRR